MGEEADRMVEWETDGRLEAAERAHIHKDPSDEAGVRIIDPKLPLGPGFEEYLPSDATEAEKILLRREFHAFWGKPSPHLDGNYVTTLPGLILHTRAVEALAKGEDSKRSRVAAREERKAEREERQRNREARAVQSQADIEFSMRFVAWQEECRQRNVWIAGKKEAWRAAVAGAKESRAQWDAYVARLRAEAQAAEATQPPAMPVRSA